MNPDAAAVLGGGGAVLWWPDSPPVEELVDVAAALGRRCFVLSTTGATDKAGLLDACAQAFALPDWFGMNWDALQECLLDLDLAEGGAAGRAAVVLWTDWAGLEQSAPDDLTTALGVFEQAVLTWATDGVPFRVLLLGPGPDLVLASVSG